MPHAATEVGKQFIGQVSIIGKGITGQEIDHAYKVSRLLCSEGTDRSPFGIACDFWREFNVLGQVFEHGILAVQKCRVFLPVGNFKYLSFSVGRRHQKILVSLACQSLASGNR